MKRATARALGKYAEKTGASTADVKRGWLKLSHRQRGKVREQLARAERKKEGR